MLALYGTFNSIFNGIKLLGYDDGKWLTEEAETVRVWHSVTSYNQYNRNPVLEL
jgi:hypothetical protein